MRTITITDHFFGKSVRYEIRQGRRRNQIIPTCFGQRFFQRPACGWDFFLRKLRPKLLCRWIVAS